MIANKYLHCIARSRCSHATHVVHVQRTASELQLLLGSRIPDSPIVDSHGYRYVEFPYVCRPHPGPAPL